MIVFPHGKINLGLQVLAKRPDGFHDLESVFYPIPLFDALEVQQANQLQLILSGQPVAGDPENNICLQAYRLLQQRIPDLAPVTLYLHKNIPSGAGLGGGSSDGAQTLRLLDRFLGLKLPSDELQSMAAALGSDCSFFMDDRPAFVQGRGERLQRVNLDLSAWSLLLVHPPVHVPTAWAYSKIIPVPGRPTTLSVLRRPVSEWKYQLVNDFEAPVTKAHPQLAQVKEKLYAAGAVYASMSGSGSSFFGIFPKNQVPKIDFAPTITTHILK